MLIIILLPLVKTFTILDPPTMSAFGARRKARKIRVREDGDDENDSSLDGWSATLQKTLNSLLI